VGVVADVPAGVVTLTLATPAPGGLTAVIVPLLTTTMSVAGVVPKSTTVAPLNPVPVIVTEVPPAAGPLDGLIPLIVGAATAVYVNWSAGEVADVPRGVATVTFTVPVPAGLSAVIVVSLTTVTPVAAFVPKSTAAAPVKPVPVIVTAAVLREANAHDASAIRLANDEADQAMAWLNKSVAAGYNDVAEIKTGKDFDTLRDRPDFKKLLAKLDKQK
jgi:hypothetical protein